MKNILISLAVVALAGAASAQTTYLSEDFSSGVPPTGWTHVNNNANPASAGWIVAIDGSGRAQHEDESGGIGQTDNTLVSPALDLTGASAAWLHFKGETNFAQWLANHPSSVGNGVSTIEVSTDGGLSWLIIWIDTSLNSGDTYAPDINLAQWVGMNNVQIGIHFSGDFAQEWWVDNVVVDDQAPGGGPTLTISGTCPGVMTITASGLTAGGPVAVVRGPSGAFVVPGGSCAGVALDISVPTLVAVINANGSGDINLAPNIPGSLCGSTLQMLDLSACVATNSVIL